jgi:hypothetical protein
MMWNKNLFFIYLPGNLTAKTGLAKQKNRLQVKGGKVITSDENG